MMINTNCCCDKRISCDYDIALLITEEKVSINAPILETPSVSFYIQEFLGFSGGTLNQYIDAGPIEGQKENTPLYKELYESLTGKTFDGIEGCCKDPKYYFLDHNSINMSSPKYLGTHYKDEKKIFYQGNSNSNEKYLHSLVKQTLILPNKFKDHDHPGLTLFSEIANLNKIQTELNAESRVKSLLKHAFSYFFKRPNQTSYNNYYKSIDDAAGDSSEQIGYYYNAIIDWNTVNRFRETDKIKLQPKIISYYTDHPNIPNTPCFYSPPFCSGSEGNCDSENYNYSIPVSNPPINLIEGASPNESGSFVFREVNFDRASHGISYINTNNSTYAWDGTNTTQKEKIEIPIYNKIPIYFPPANLKQNIGYTLSVQYTDNLPVFSGVDEDFLIHYTGLTLGFVNNIAPITYKFDVDTFIKNIKLSKKLININEIIGVTLEYKYSGLNSFNTSKFSSNSISYLRYLNKADMINDEEVERLKQNYYRYKNAFIRAKTIDRLFNNMAFSTSNFNSFQSTLNFPYFDDEYQRFETDELFQFCSAYSGHSCIEYPSFEPKYINDFSYENSTNLAERVVTEAGNEFLYNSWGFTTRYPFDYAVRITPYFINFSYFNNETEGYKPNTVSPIQRKVNQNINDYFHHGVYFDLNRSFQLKKLWETHLSYFWGPMSMADIEPTIDDTEDKEYRFLKNVYPVVSVNRELCSAKSDPKAWSVYFTVHNDVIPNNDIFEQYFFLNENEDSYVKTTTLMSKYQENIKLSVKVLRILKDSNPYELQGISYTNKDKKRIKFIDPEYTISETLNTEQEINNNDVGMDEYEFLQPIHEETSKKYNCSLIQNKNLKIKENNDTNNIIVFEDTLPNNTFFDKEQNQRNFSANLNDNITLAPWSRENKNPNPNEIGAKMIIHVAGIQTSNINTIPNSTKPFFIGRTYSSNGWDFWGDKTYENYYFGAHDTLLADVNLRRAELLGRELNLPLITNYSGEKISGKQIVIPYLKFTRNTSTTFTKNDTEWKQYYQNGLSRIDYYPTERDGVRSLQAEYNVDINDSSAYVLNPFLLYEPPVISEYYKSGYGLYKNNLYSHLDYKNIKETDLFEAWKDETIAFLQYDYINYASLCRNVDCLALIDSIEKTNISDKLYFINPICRKNNFNFDVKTRFEDEEYIRNYSGIFNNYKVGGVYGPENGTSPYVNSMLYGHEHIDSFRSQSPKPAINRIGTVYPPHISGYHYRNAIQNLKNLLSKNIDIGSRNNNSEVFSVKQRIINTNIETIPLEINLYNNRNQEMYIQLDWTWFSYECNSRYSNYYYYTNTSPLEVDLRRSLKLIYDANSMNSNYANIDLFKKITNPISYYSLFSTENTSQPIAQIDGKKQFQSNNIISNYITKKIDGNLSINENLTYCAQYCYQNNHPVCEYCNYWLYWADIDISKTYWYPYNFGGLVLDTDTYAFKYDYTKTKTPEIQFMMWHTGIDFGQFNNDLFNLRNSYVSLNNENYKNGWLIKKNQPDQYFVDNLLESIQEKYIEFQYFEQFILSAIETVDNLTDVELYCLTVNNPNSNFLVGKNISNTRPFERKLSYSGRNNDGDWLAVQNNRNIFLNFGRYTFPEPACSNFEPIDYGQPPIPNLILSSNTYAARWNDPLRGVPVRNTEVEERRGSDGKSYYSVSNTITPGQVLPQVKRIFYYIDENNNLRSSDITNSFYLNQTLETVNLQAQIPPGGRGIVWTTKMTTVDNLIAGTLNWYNNTFRGTNRLTMKEAIIASLNNLIEEKRTPFLLLEQLFGTIPINFDIVNEKNLKRMSTKIGLQNHYNLTRIEKTKSTIISHTLPRFLGSNYQIFNRIVDNGGSSQYRFTLKQEFQITDFIYFKDADYISYKTSNECWPNIKSIEMYSNNLAKIKYDTVSNQPHFLKGLLVSQGNPKFDFHNKANTLNTFNENDSVIRDRTDILDYNFYRDEGYYLDMSKDYEVYMPQIPMTFTYDALPSFDKLVTEIPYTVIWSWGSIWTGTVGGVNEVNVGSLKLEYLFPKQIVYTNVKSTFDLAAFISENKKTIKNTFYEIKLFSHGNNNSDDRGGYDNIIISGVPPMQIRWIKPNGFVLNAVPFNRIELVIGSYNSTINVEYLPARREIPNAPYQYEDILQLGTKTISTPELGDDRICYDEDCDQYHRIGLTSQQAAALNGTYFAKYPSYYNLLSSYVVAFNSGSYYLRTPYYYEKFYDQQTENKLAHGDIFNCLSTFKFATTRTHSFYTERMPVSPYDRDYSTTSFGGFYNNLGSINWSNYVTFTRPKIKVKGIPVQELKLIDFSSLFKDKHLINDVLYPLYGNFAKK